MAKKKEKVVETTVETVVEPPKPVIDKIIPPTKKKNTWEIKNRMYILKNGMEPLTYTISANNLLYFDKEKGYEREIAYAPNQHTAFVDEMKGNVRREHIVFRNGSLYVPKNKVTLQKFLSIYHPLKDKLYYEVDKKADAIMEYDYLEMELEAMNIAQSLDLNEAEAVLRVEKGSSVDKMSNKELKRDILVMAKSDPRLFLDIVDDDNIHLRNLGIKATEGRIISLSPDQRTFSWESTGRKLMTVPFDEHPYTALAHWFKTDEGMEVLKSIEKRMK